MTCDRRAVHSYFVTGAIVIAIVGVFFDGPALPMVAGLAACALVPLGLAQASLGRGRAVEAAAAE